MTTLSIPSIPSKRDIGDAEALSRAESGISARNYGLILDGFANKGIPVADIEPRVNVFTYRAWRAKGRQVRRGEHGVRVVTFIDCEKTDKRTGKTDRYSRPWHSTVFHVSQTDPIE